MLVYQRVMFFCTMVIVRVQISLFLFVFFTMNMVFFLGWEGSDLFDPYLKSWTRSIPGQFLDNKDEM